MTTLNNKKKKIIKKEGDVTNAFRLFIREMFSPENTSRIVSPNSLLSEIGKRQSRFRGGRQQDSHELLCYLFEFLHNEDTKRSGNKGIFLEVFGFFEV